MPKTREQKGKDVELLEGKLAENKSVVFANYYGLKVKDIESLRKNCRENNLYCQVMKKSLLKIALKKKGMEDGGLDGEVVAIFGKDEVIPAKVSATYAKTHEFLKIVSGIVDGKPASAEQVLALSKLPSKEELLARLVGSLNSPISGFVNVLAGNLRNLVYVLNAIKQKSNL